MTQKLHELLGAVLAGGLSSRMGQDKTALRPWGNGGPSMLEHALGLLAPFTAQTVIACRAGQHYHGYTCIEDAIAGAGPVQGLLGCLLYARTWGFKAVLVLGCDQPGLTVSLLEELVDAYSGAPATLATLFQNTTTGRYEMLVAIYSTNLIDILKEGLQRGERSIYQIIPKTQIQSLPYNQERAHFFLNLNTPGQLQAFSAAWKQKG